MTGFGCAREPETAALLERGQWPQASPADLRAHVENCRTCRERVLLTEKLQAARTAAMAKAELPAAGALWWRAQLRRRNAALERVNRPMLGAQIFALAIVAALAVGSLAWALRAGLRPVAWLAAATRELHWSALAPDGLLGSGAWWWLAPVLGMLVLAGGVAVYFATEKQ